MSKKPTVLMILDGYGLNENKEANAVAEAKTPVMDKLMKEYPFVKGNASGMAVGLGSFLDEIVVDVPDKIITIIIVYLIVKGLVCLMEDLRKVCGAFIIDRAIHEVHKDKAAY